MTDVASLISQVGEDLETAPAGDVADLVLARSRRYDRRRAATGVLVVALAAGGGFLLQRPGGRQTITATPAAGDPFVQGIPSGVYGPDPYLADPAGTGLVAVLHVPRLGSGYLAPVREGVDVTTLQSGPGHYPGSAAPGGDGNVAISGHRTTYGKPFVDLDKVAVGDTVALETSSSWYVYRATRSLVVDPTDIDVVAPAPTGEDPGQRLLTLTTCTPEYSATQRLVVRAVLVESDAKADHPAGWVPPALADATGPAADAGAPAEVGSPVTGAGPTASESPYTL